MRRFTTYVCCASAADVSLISGPPADKDKERERRESHMSTDDGFVQGSLAAGGNLVVDGLTGDLAEYQIEHLLVAALGSQAERGPAL